MPMPPPKGYKLCTCTESGCIKTQVKHPDTGAVITGQYLSASTWKRHREAQTDADLAAQTERLESLTLLRTVASPQVVAAVLPPSSSSPSKRTLPTQDLRTQTASAPTVVDSPAVDRSHAALRDLATAIDQKINVFTPSSLSLRFVYPPDSTSRRTLPDEHDLFTLTYHHPANDALVRFEQWLTHALQALDAIDCHADEKLLSKQGEYKTRIQDTLRRVGDIKKAEWYRQETLQKRSKKERDPQDPEKVNTDPFLPRNRAIQQMGSIALVCTFLVTVLRVLCGVSRDRCNFILVALRYVVNQCFSTAGENEWQHIKSLSSIPRDIRTVLQDFDIHPKVTHFVCCPACCALYPPDAAGQADDCPEKCVYQEIKDGPTCGATLRRVRYIKGEPCVIPIRTFGYQDFPTWLARFMCRPKVEDIIDKPLEDIHLGRKDVYHDIWDGPVVRNLLGADGQPFFRYKGPEARLLFGFGYDGFNPFHMKAAGKIASVGAIYLFCYNLPPEDRLKHENIYIAGIVPGPKAPSLTQSNHYIRPLLRHFEIFYSRGYHLSETPAHPNGRLSKGVIIPLIMDLHAMRQITGTGSPTAKFFCTFCSLLFQDIENVFPNTWPPARTYEEHLRLSERWLDATTVKEREEIFKNHSLRWTEFFKLPYWRPSTSMVVDTMHAWYLNDFKILVREIWGVDHRRHSGDGLDVGKEPKHKQPVAKKELLRTFAAFGNGDQSVLNKARKIVLFRICQARGLRRANTCHQMIETLKEHYDKNPDDLDADTLAARNMPEPKVADSISLATTRSRLLAVTSDSRVADSLWLSKCRKSGLQSLCRERQLSTKGYRDDLAQRLVIHQLAHPELYESLPDSPGGRAVLGSDMIASINSDMSRTVLPSWVSTGAKSFDASEHGKLSADEWRTAVLIRLAITLPRVWGPQGGRRTLMLDNFMHLANAVIVASTRAVVIHPSPANGTTISTANLYRQEYQAYLQGRVELYPTGKIQPTEHISHHVAEKLEQFGPIHNTRTNAGERWNGVMQDIPINMRFGELEKTILDVFSMGSNLKAAINDHGAPKPLQDLREPFEAAFGLESGSALLSDMMGSSGRNFNSPCAEDLAKSKKILLTPDLSDLLIKTLNSEHESSLAFRRYIPSNRRQAGCISLDPEGWLLSECRFQGVWYRKARPTESPYRPGTPFVPHKDSHVLLKSTHDSRPVPHSIHNIFAHRHMVPGTPKPVLEIYLVVRRYLELTPKHATLDFWRKYPISGGRLYYDDLQRDPEVVNVKDVVGHFAKTPYAPGDIAGLNRPTVHVLPLVWHHMFDWLSFIGVEGEGNDGEK